jgi:hypothetical protein
MRRGAALRRLLLATALLLPGPAAHALPAASTLVLLVDGSTARTSFATVAGEPYLVTVSGQYTYDGGKDFADCGHWHPEFATGWTSGGFFTVDGHPGGCADLPYSDTHTYQWTELGTGRPFEFSVWDAGYADNYGAFSVTVTGARADTAHEVAGFCSPLGVVTPVLDYVPIVVQANAEAVRDTPSSSTFVVCDVTSASGESAHLALGAPGPTVWTATRMVVPQHDPLTICWHSGGTWDDGVDVTTATYCYTTVLVQ